MEPYPNQRVEKLFWKFIWQEWKIKQYHIHNPSLRPTVHHHLIWLAWWRLGNTPPFHYLASSNVANLDLQMRKMPMKEICKSCVRARGVRRIVRTDCGDQQIDWYRRLLSCYFETEAGCAEQLQWRSAHEESNFISKSIELCIIVYSYYYLHKVNIYSICKTVCYRKNMRITFRQKFSSVICHLRCRK